MADDNNSLSESEAQTYNPQLCPACGERSLYYDLVPVADLGTPETRYLPGPGRCRNPRCAGGPGSEDT
jgi:hypothetical protein